MPLRHFLPCLDSNEYQTLGFLMFPLQEHVWFIGCVFNTPYPTCASSMLWLCIAHSYLLHTPLLPLSCIGLYLVSSSQHVMFTLCFVAIFFFCLRFELHFLIHLTPLMHYYHIGRTFNSWPHFSLTLCLFVKKRGRVYSREYTREFFHFYMTLVHIFRGRNSISCAHLQGERYFIGEMHIPRQKRHCVNKKTLFYLCFFIFVFLFALQCFELCLVSILCCSHCIVFVCWTCIHSYAIVLH